MPPRSGVVSAVLAVVFAVLVGVWLMLSSHLNVPSWGMLLAGLSLLGWAVRFIVRAVPAGALPQDDQRRRSHSAQARARVVLVVVITLAAALSGALSAGATHGITLIPAAICLSTLVSDEEVPPVAGVLFSLLLVLVAGIAVLAAGLQSAAPLWSVLAAFGLAFLGGMGASLTTAGRGRGHPSERA